VPAGCVADPSADSSVGPSVARAADPSVGLSVSRRIRLWIKAYSRKINPITLTIVSTILGLLPFLSDGPEEVFWFDFAVGTISGMLFSIIAVIFLLPIFSISRRQ
jgi:multidrug efflux pump subunit AcrB